MYENGDCSEFYCAYLSNVDNINKFTGFFAELSEIKYAIVHTFDG